MNIKRECFAIILLIVIRNVIINQRVQNEKF